LDEIQKYYLHPSQLVVSDQSLWVSTVLGSCVAVCLYDQMNQVGGMNHFMLPLWNGDGLESPRYGNIAIPRLIDSLMTLNCQRDNLVAKIFGGANVLGESVSMFRVGERNTNLAKQLLEERNIPVVAASTGGDRGRKILFNTTTGEVLHRYLNRRR